MAVKNKKAASRQKIKRRIRKKIRGSADRPRLSVYRSNKEIYAQIIDDENGKTLVSASSREKTIAEKSDINKSEKAKLVGISVAEKAVQSEIKTVVMDRNGYLYHGRVKALAEGARKGGLKF
ncbi:MAG: 50S ribosomal protein L18 [Bacteroidales bacterium]|nr:50S ribosomal protein L18 [Bacteroidales bacterium]